MGVFAGAYLYVSAFAPTHQGELADDDVSQQTLVINGQMYGGCSQGDSCASFKLLNARTYSYLPVIDSEVKTGRLSNELHDALLDALDESSLEHYAQKAENMQCESYADGNDYTYTVSQFGKTYILDTCTSQLAFSRGLQSLLIDVWSAMDNPPQDAVDTFEFNGNIFDFLWDRFHQR